MLSFLRAPHPPRTNSASHNPVLFENGRSSLFFRQAGSDFLMQHKYNDQGIYKLTNQEFQLKIYRFPPEDGDESVVKPPFHFHIHQDEHFNIVSGAVHVYRGQNPKPWKTLSANSDSLPKTASVPKLVYHRLQNASSTEELLLDIHLAPENYEAEQRFFRNFFGYLNDCKRAGEKPSPFQLFVFLHAADIPLAVPAPVDWVGVWVSRVLLVGMAFVGRYLLGYQVTYPEYYSSRKSL